MDVVSDGSVHVLDAVCAWVALALAVSFESVAALVAVNSKTVTAAALAVRFGRASVAVPEGRM